MGKRKFLTSELVAAFGGTLQPGRAAPSVHKFGNPAPLGLTAFAVTMFVEGLIQAGAMGVKNDHVVTGLALFYGGLIQLLVGMWCMAIENTFAATTLTSHAGFWISQAVSKIPFFQITYATSNEMTHAVGFFYLAWFLFNAMITLCTMKSTLALFSFCLGFDIYLLLCTIASMGNHPQVFKGAGVIGVIVSFLAFYNAYAGIANSQNAYITARAVKLPIYGEEKENIDLV